MDTNIEMNPLIEANSGIEEVKIDLDTTTTLSMHTSEEDPSDHSNKSDAESEDQFLVSFMVDAQGGTKRGCRFSGVKVVIPPGKASMPTNIICRYLKNNRDLPTPLKEGEILVSKILKLSPVGAKFLGPVTIEIPHCNSIESSDREHFVLRLDTNGQWNEHLHETTENNFDHEDHENYFEGATTKIFTTDFPRCFLIASRIKQDNFWIGPDGRIAKSSVEPGVKVVFLPNAVSRLVRVGIQVLHVNTNLASSPIVTIEPRRKKVKKAVTVTIPLPEGTKNLNNLKLLSSISGGTDKAEWKDVTNRTKLTFSDTCVQFQTAVTGRFWLLETENTLESSEIESIATKLYYETIQY